MWAGPKIASRYNAPLPWFYMANTLVVGKHQITSDGLPSYIPAIGEYFGADVD
jgi:hypothetical protein